MSYYNYLEVMVQLDTVAEIVNQTLWYIYKPEMINDIDELCCALQSISEVIIEIKEILERELMKNEGYTEPQDESSNSREHHQ